MLGKTEWHQTGRIIIQVFSGMISLTDVEAGWQDVMSLVKSSSEPLPVHLILDFSQREGYEAELFKLPTMRYLFDLSSKSKRLEWLIVVQAAPNPIMLFTSTLAARFTSHKFRVVATVEEAIRYLRYTDSSLIESPKNPDS
jgi:hypothetical protein